MNTKNIIYTVFLFIVLTTELAAKELVQFGGFSYLGEHSDLELNYPYTRSIDKESPGEFDAVLSNKIGGNDFESFQIDKSGLTNLDSETGLAFSFALDNESVSIEKIGDSFKLLITLSAQVLFFDFKEKQLVASYPVRVQYIDVLQEYPDEQYIKGKIRDIYFNQQESNIFSQFVETAKSIQLKRKYQARIKVNNVVLEEKAKSILSDTNNESLRAYETYIAQSFTQFLSSNQQVAVLPYTKGHAIGNKMAARFANGEVYSLVIPESDFDIDLIIRGFKKVEYSKNEVGSAWVYGSYIAVKVLEPMSGEVYFDRKVKNGVTKKVPVTQVLVDDKAAFEESLLVLFDNFTKSISEPSKEWIEAHIGSGVDINEFKKLKRVIELCK